MKKAFFSLCLFLIALTSLKAQGLQSPDEFLGYELGTRYTPHHKVVAYYRHVANQMNNVKLHKYGETNELRPLVAAILSSQENMNRWEQIRTDNLKRARLMEGKPEGAKTGIVWMSYNVHGNEASTTETALKTLYELARPDNQRSAAWLKNTVVILDPCLNPDGRDRYASWINQVTGSSPNPDIDAKEHHEPWPGGRPNHYYFDLNRDWAWQTQVESRQRMKFYNSVMPHIHADYHEQGVNSPYYFAPAAEPVHEQVTDWQREFQEIIGRNHARYFDENSWLFFTKESFDLLYPSYGDTYPMYNGAIGMTYEQAGHSTSGLAIETEEGDTLTLMERIAHHHATGLSTIETASKNSERMVDEFEGYFTRAVNQPKGRYKTYIIKSSNHPDKLKKLKAFLKTHQIRYGTGSSRKPVSAFDYTAGSRGDVSIQKADILISAYQPKAVLVQVFFEPETYLINKDTYDITAWAVPYMMGLDVYATEAKITVSNGKFPAHKVTTEVSDTPAAYLAKWESLEDAKFLAQLLKHKVKLRFATYDFSVAGRDFAKGTLIITRKGNRHKGSQFDELVKETAVSFGRDLFSTPTTFVESGKDFGSGNVPFLQAPKILVLRGKGVSSLSFGAFWHFMEQELNYPITIVDTDDFGKVELNQYNTLVMPGGSYGQVLSKSKKDELKRWIRDGGRVLAIEKALNSFANQDGFGLKHFATDEEKKAAREKSDEEKEANALTPYAQRKKKHEPYRLPGAVFKLKIDNSHPLGYGYESHYFTLKNNSSRYAYLPNGWNVGIIENENAHVAGLAGARVKQSLAKSMVFGVENMGKGTLVYMADDPLFRAFWENGKLLIANALFMAGQ